jgi:hypothetical protein
MQSYQTVGEDYDSGGIVILTLSNAVLEGASSPIREYTGDPVDQFISGLRRASQTRPRRQEHPVNVADDETE